LLKRIKMQFFKKKKIFKKKIFFCQKKVDNFGGGSWPVGFPVKLREFRLKPAV